MKLKTTTTKARPRKVLKPTLTLRPDRKCAKAGERIEVSVGFAGLDRVELSLEPKRGFEVDLRSMRKPGIARLKARMDGTSTLIAKGFVGTKAVLEKMVHVRCDGPEVRIIAFGYLPKR